MAYKKKEKQLHFRVTDKEYDEIIKQADKYNMSLSEYFRELIKLDKEKNFLTPK